MFDIDASPAPPAVTVEAVTVRAARLPPPQGDAAFSVVRIDAGQLQDRPSLDDALSQVPGLSLFRRSSSLSANPTTQGLGLRAIAPSGAGRTLVTLDGVPQNDPFGGWVIWTALPPEQLGGAAVIRGAGAGPYGAGALTGTVALEERTDAAGHWRGDLSGGELGTARAYAGGDLGVGSATLSLTASGERSGGWIPVRQGRGPADARLSLDAREASARYAVDAGPGLMALRLSAYDEDRGTGVVGGAARAAGTAQSLTWAAQPTAAAAGWRLQLWARQSDFSQTSLSVAPGRATATPANSQDATPATGVGFNAAWRRATARGSWEVGVDAREAVGETRERFRFMGADFTRDRIAGGKTAVAGLYAEGASIQGPWLLTAGLRADAWRSWDGKRTETDRATGVVTLNDRPADQSGVTPTARAGVRRDLGGGLYLRGAAYAGFRPPTLNELHRPFRVGNDITESNPGLKPERLYGAELGAGRAGADWSVDADLFLNRLVDPVTNVTLGVGPGTFPRAGFVPASGTFRQRQNAGAIRALGLEAEARRSLLAGRLELRAALSATDARVEGGTAAPQLTGLRPAEAPVWTVTSGLVWKASARLELGADLRWESRRFEDDQNLRPLKTSAGVDADVRWRLGPRAQLFLGARNLFDQASPTGAAADGTISYGAPRIVSFGLRIAG